VLEPKANEEEAYIVTTTTTNTQTREGGISVTYPAPAATFKLNVVKQGELAVQQTLKAWRLSVGPEVDYDSEVDHQPEVHYNSGLVTVHRGKLPLVHGC